ncbi:MAG TPA: NUDIX domain-containing protein, partial [Ktedonobacteraceae bacterium]
MPQERTNSKEEQNTPDRPQVSVGILITKDDQVLLMKRGNLPGDGIWFTPGRRLAYGERPEQCIFRETQEEMGLIITDVTFLAITNDVIEPQKKHLVTIWLAARYSSGELTLAAAQEMSAADWFCWDAPPEPLFLPLEHLLTGQC